MIHGRSRKPTPRLAAELDDAELGRACRQLTGRGTARTLAAPIVERLLDDTGRDWDRRAHRLAALAAVTRPSIQRSWAELQPNHPDAQTLAASTQTQSIDHQTYITVPEGRQQSPDAPPPASSWTLRRQEAVLATS
ncbi:hypothetical protein ABZX77_46945 [Streptomyces sp. NPDC004237]|uniref:hypothetical protein n=1 Tax=Streptomyces sp. NPDC004237 TaxID=3154455 RepID=UPI0033AAF687